MSAQDFLNSIELERIERELYALSEMEQAAQHRSLALPVGYKKSQALAEHWNAAAAWSAASRRRERLLAIHRYRAGCADLLGVTIDELMCCAALECITRSLRNL